MLRTVNLQPKYLADATDLGVRLIHRNNSSETSYKKNERDSMTGLEVKLKRIRAGLKQYQVAAAVGISPNRLCEIELGRRKVEPDLLKHICEVIEDKKPCKS